MEDLSNYDKLREDAQKLYSGTRPILSAALNDYVHFTAEGFNHIIFKGSRSERERPSQILRFKLLPRAIKLVAHSNFGASCPRGLPTSIATSSSLIQ